MGGQAFLQVKNIDDDNAEAAEMARLEAKKELEKAKMFLQVQNKSEDEEKRQKQCCKRKKACCNKGRQGKGQAFLQVKNIDDDNAEAAEMARLEAKKEPEKAKMFL